MTVEPNTLLMGGSTLGNVNGNYIITSSDRGKSYRTDGTLSIFLVLSRVDNTNSGYPIFLITSGSSTMWAYGSLAFDGELFKCKPRWKLVEFSIKNTIVDVIENSICEKIAGIQDKIDDYFMGHSL